MFSCPTERPAPFSTSLERLEISFLSCEKKKCVPFLDVFFELETGFVSSQPELT
jgi:hypothetical protein